MYIQQFYTSCLSEAAYYIESKGEVAIIDPLRDIQAYLDLAKERNVVIKYIFETHFHADFISGHIDLHKATGAPIIYGPGAFTHYKIQNAADGEVFPLGEISITALHTPGHTLESTCYLLKDATKKDHAIFSGDTLFVGDVGRPDLSSGNMSTEELAGIMYETIQKKILPLADDVIVYPAHGPGSSCGKSLGPETHTTIGAQKAANYALQPQTKEEFITAVTDGLADAPVYFSVNAGINQKGYKGIDEVVEQGTKALSVKEFKNLGSEVIKLDTRPATTFTQGFIPDSIFIGLEGRFAEWAGNILPYDKEIALIVPEGKEEETVIRLSRVGFDKVIGFLAGGFEAWQTAGEPVDMIIDIESDELLMDLPHDPKMVVVDVRKPIEFADGHLEDAVNISLATMTDVVNFASLEDDQNLYIHCAGGYRSVIAGSILKKHGYDNLRNVLGGYGKIKEEPKAIIVKDASVLN